MVGPKLWTRSVSLSTEITFSCISESGRTSITRSSSSLVLYSSRLPEHLFSLFMPQPLKPVVTLITSTVLGVNENHVSKSILMQPYRHEQNAYVISPIAPHNSLSADGIEFNQSDGGAENAHVALLRQGYELRGQSSVMTEMPGTPRNTIGAQVPMKELITTYTYVLRSICA